MGLIILIVQSGEAIDFICNPLLNDASVLVLVSVVCPIVSMGNLKVVVCERILFVLQNLKNYRLS